MRFLRVVWMAAIVLGLSLVSGAQQNGEWMSSSDAGEKIQNLDVIKKQLRDYYTCTCSCGCYQKDLDAQAEKAIVFLKNRAAHRKAGEKLTMVLDIDETSLSNYEVMRKDDFGFNSSEFNSWLEAGKAPAIPGTLRLFQQAKQLGVSVIFLTGRAESQRAATERNLRAQGFEGWEKLILRTVDEKKQTATVYKSSERAKLVASGYTLVLSVGDQWSDLKGAPEAEFSVKYPNPYYFLP